MAPCNAARRLTPNSGRKGEQMTELLIGLVLWWGLHLFGRMAPGLRRDLTQALGEKIAKGLIGVVLILSVVLMVRGYRAMAFVPIYTPLPGMGHLNNLIMLVALFVFGIGIAGGRLNAKIRHPMLWGLILWSVAHLLVNGDLASLLLFGGLGLWAPLQMRLINQHEGPWERPLPGDVSRDWKLALAALFLFVFIAGIHWLAGHNPFLGTYP